MYIKDNKIQGTKSKDLSKLDKTIEHMWIDCQGKNKDKNCLEGVFY